MYNIGSTPLQLEVPVMGTLHCSPFSEAHIQWQKRQLTTQQQIFTIFKNCPRIIVLQSNYYPTKSFHSSMINSSTRFNKHPYGVTFQWLRQKRSQIPIGPKPTSPKRDSVWDDISSRGTCYLLTYVHPLVKVFEWNNNFWAYTQMFTVGLST